VHYLSAAPRSSSKWVGRGGHMASDTWWLLSRDWGRRTIQFVRLMLKVNLKSHGLCGITWGIRSRSIKIGTSSPIWMGTQWHGFFRKCCDMCWPVHSLYSRSIFSLSHALPDKEWEYLCGRKQTDQVNRTRVYYVLSKTRENLRGNICIWQ
jgi:hypothetical protein